MKKPMLEMAPPKKSILIRIDEDLKTKAKVKLAKEGKSFQSILERAIIEYLNTHQCPKCSTVMNYVLGYKYNCPQCERTFKI